MLRPVDLSASGVITWGAESGPGSVQVTAEGLSVGFTSGGTVEKEAWEIRRVRREDYALTVELAGDEALRLEQFARRTDELERALWRCRCDGIAELMAPADERPLEVVEASGEASGSLYRYEDGLRWVPREGACFARLYGELEGSELDAESYTLALYGPFGEDLLAGLARRATELQHEVRQRVAEARETFAESLQEAGWAGLKTGPSSAEEARSGAIRQHVPFEASEDRLGAAEALVVEERKEYWQALREDALIARLVVSSDEEGELRLVALCPVAGGELYEVLSEGDHASFVFKRADPVVLAWTEVGFRREPIFEEEAEDEGPYETLAELLPSLAEARTSLVKRVIHDSVEQWRAALR